MSRKVGLLLLAAVVGAACAPSSVEAQSLDDARARWFEADFERARREFSALLTSSALDAPTALEAHRHLAVLYLVLEDDQRARDHAEAAVGLDRSVVPPAGAPAAAQELFRSARERLGGAEATLTIEPVTPFVAGQTARVRAGLEPAPRALAASVRLRCGDAEARSAAPAVEVEITADGTVRCTAEALSPRGAALFSVDRELAMTEDDPRERRALPWILGATAAGAAAAAVVVAVAVSRDSSAEFGGTTVVGW